MKRERGEKEKRNSKGGDKGCLIEKKKKKPQFQGNICRTVHIHRGTACAALQKALSFKKYIFR